MTETINTSNKVYGYVRVSTKAQIKNNSIEEQKERILSKYADAIIYEENRSGAELSETLLEIISNMKEGDRLVVTKVDRLSRDVIYGLNYFDEINSIGASLEVLDCGEIDNSAYKRLMITNLLAMAEFERISLRDKMQNARNIAKTKIGYKEGRPKIYSEEELKKACEMLNTYSYKKVAYLTGISISTLTRAMRNKRKAEIINEDDLIDDYCF